MLKNLCQLEHTVENKACRFICDHDTPIHYIKEALFQFGRYIGQLEDTAKAKMEEQSKADLQEEPTKIEEEKPCEASECLTQES